MTSPSSAPEKHSHRVEPFMPEGQEYWEALCVDPNCRYPALARELAEARDSCFMAACFGLGYVFQIVPNEEMLNRFREAYDNRLKFYAEVLAQHAEKKEG